ncbi:TQO small subunit DoxD [Martelella sp. HB161492]|uniref:TQO small subunit DoxD n=1 Tax=Martelella sp. HB161492 TaxID=2720726 RepID=UPI0015915FC0|nr:TQO small subunit DoxD [Martelella sp. HB161492]
MSTTDLHSDSRTISPSAWQLIGAAILANRLVIGWVYWGGFSRRFIYDLKKIDPESPGYLANKLVHAAPGVPFGFDNIVHWLLDHGTLLHIAVISFSLIELVVGIGLILGLATRFVSLVGIGLSVTLMIIFGWMGTTCLDEWTMAACSFAMTSVTLVTGSGPYSVDNLLVKSGRTQKTPWLAWATSGPIPLTRNRFIAITTLLGVIAFIFTVFFYGFYFDAIYSPLGKRYNNLVPRITMSEGVLSNGTASVHVYMDRGPDTQGAYIIQASLAGKDSAEAPIATFTAEDLDNADRVTITDNRFAPWSTCKQISYGIRCQLGSQAVLNFTLPADISAAGDLVLTLTDIEGKTFAAPVSIR